MSHFYQINKDGTARLLKTIDTVAKDRKSPKVVVPSVTTVLGVAPNPFMAKWREAKLIELARKHPDLDYEKLSELAWGTRTCPETGDTISSSDFGTALHAALEEFNNCGIDINAVDEEEKYYPWVDLWADWVEQNDVDILHAELCVGCTTRKVAGTIDFIGKMDGKVFLADYKSRPFVGKSTLPVYPKDVQQLAIEAQIIKELWNLDYLPATYSVILDTDQPAMKLKKHTEAAQAKAYDKAMACCEFFNRYHNS